MFFATLLATFIAGSLANTRPIYESVPLEQHGKPSSLLTAEYSLPRASDSVVNSINVQIQTEIPALNLDNVPGLRKVACVGSLIRVVLDDASVAKDWLRNDKGLLVLINPQWNCGAEQGTPTYRHVYSVKVSQGVAYLNTKEAQLSKHTNNILIKIGSLENKDGGYLVDWKSPQNGVLFQDYRVSAECNDCTFKGNFGVLLNITKPRFVGAFPKVETQVNSALQSRMNLKLTRKEGPSFSKSMEFYRKTFDRFEMPGLFKIDPYFVLNGAVGLPAGPATAVSASFSVDAPKLSVQPKFQGHEFSVESDEADLTLKVSLLPKMMLSVNLFDQLTVPVGAGLDAFIEGNVQTAESAQPECEFGQSKLSLHVGAKTHTFLMDDEPKPVGVFAKKQFYYTCRNENVSQ